MVATTNGTEATSSPQVFSENEWAPLKTVIVGRAAGSRFPSEPIRMTKATMPPKYVSEFKPGNPFPARVLDAADSELDQFASILTSQGITVHRPNQIDWLKTSGGYTGAMPRDGLLVVGRHIIESCYAWKCRHDEVQHTLGDLLDKLEQDPSVKVIRAPKPPQPDTLYDDPENDGDNIQAWAVNNSRPAFDAADFCRFGKTLIGRFSNVTNAKGIEYVRQNIPEGYTVEILDLVDWHAMHIDTVLLPLRKGLLVYNPARVTEKALRKHSIFDGWDLRPLPFTPKPRIEPPSYMCSDWIVMNVLVLGNNKVMCDVADPEFADFLRERGMEPVMCPFRHVNSIGGSFHCATSDLLRLE